jgi:predicted N-acetyltransferase YhbS
MNSSPTIRHFSTTDIPAIHTLCERALDFDTVPLPTLVHKTVKSGDYNLGFVAEIGGRIVGFIQGGMGRGKHSTIGFIRMIAVDRAFRNRGVGTDLLTALESRLISLGASTLSTGDCPHNYFQPGVDFRSTETHCFFWKHGYEFFRENHNLVAPLPPPNCQQLDQDIIALRGQGIRVALAKEEDFPACEAFLEANWESWIVEARHALDHPEGGLWLAWGIGDDGREEVVGFSAYGGNNPGLPWFGPMGTKPSMRGKGVGALLLKLCLRGLAELGYREAVIPWVGPIRFYAKFCNARVSRSFWVHRKTVC